MIRKPTYDYFEPRPSSGRIAECEEPTPDRRENSRQFSGVVAGICFAAMLVLIASISCGGAIKAEREAREMFGGAQMEVVVR